MSIIKPSRKRYPQEESDSLVSKTAPISSEKDRNSISLDLMHRMKLNGMASAFSESLSSTFAETMTPDAFLNWLLSREWDYRSAAAIERLIKMAHSDTRHILRR